MAYARSVFISELSSHLTHILADGMVESPGGIHSTLHLQQGGGATREIPHTPKCAGDVSGWEYSAVITAFIPQSMGKHEADACRKWVDLLVHAMCTQCDEVIGVYATDLGPEASANGFDFATRCWTKVTRRRLKAAKEVWDPNGLMSHHVPFVYTDVD